MIAARRVAGVTIVVALPWSGCSVPAVAQDQARCALDPREVPARPEPFAGTVVRSVPPEQVRMATRNVEKQSGARISPDYADLPRILARVSMAGRTFQTLAAAVDGRVPRAGDHVNLLSRYRDPRFPCRFIPWTIGAPNAVS